MNGDKKNLFGWAVAGVFLVMALAFFVWDDHQKSILRQKYSEKDFCPKNPAELQSHTVYILDFSDPVAHEDAMRIVNRLASSREDLSVRGKLTALFINADTVYDEVYAVCRPPVPGIRNPDWKCGRKLGGIDTARKADAKQFCDFEDKMQKLADVVVDRSKEQHKLSPLIEALAKMSLRQNFRQVPKKEIVLYSDLLQNTDAYSFYDGSVPVAKSVAANEKFALSGATISIHQIRRKPDERNKQLKARAFWRELFNLVQAQPLYFSWIE